MASLGVNIDHVATIRQARYRHGAVGVVEGTEEPDPVLAAHEAVLGGADVLTIHLREDRRHVNDRDLELLCRVARVRVNLEMAAADEMVAIALRHRVSSMNGGRPQMVTLVPEGRQEVTTEGGLDVAGQQHRMKSVVERLKGAGIVVSAFIDADLAQVDAAGDAGFDCCELHTGPYATAFASAGGDFRVGAGGAALAAALERVHDAGERIMARGMRFNAGHALNYANVRPIAELVGIEELHIGHAIVCRAVFTGMRQAVAEMKSLVAGAV
ncbi:MAG: pyridoxine 5'-phosphate synthase [Phycisphaeraceae bacterium]|nr:pyridoxine 5'-phosphate synthase [Phycisphaeraceae bacterium]MCW5769941.1 pyridoxine 5'-phosphate synthase [Phycisphaeraceae bacterium]